MNQGSKQICTSTGWIPKKYAGVRLVDSYHHVLHAAQGLSERHVQFFAQPFVGTDGVTVEWRTRLPGRVVPVMELEPDSRARVLAEADKLAGDLRDLAAQKTEERSIEAVTLGKQMQCMLDRVDPEVVFAVVSETNVGQTNVQPILTGWGLEKVKDAGEHVRLMRDGGQYVREAATQTPEPEPAIDNQKEPRNLRCLWWTLGFVALLLLLFLIWTLFLSGDKEGGSSTESPQATAKEDDATKSRSPELLQESEKSPSEAVKKKNEDSLVVDGKDKIQESPAKPQAEENGKKKPIAISIGEWWKWLLLLLGTLALALGIRELIQTKSEEGSEEHASGDEEVSESSSTSRLSFMTLPGAGVLGLALWLLFGGGGGTTPAGYERLTVQEDREMNNLLARERALRQQIEELEREYVARKLQCPPPPAVVPSTEEVKTPIAVTVVPTPPVSVPPPPSPGKADLGPVRQDAPARPALESKAPSSMQAPKQQTPDALPLLPPDVEEIKIPEKEMVDCSSCAGEWRSYSDETFQDVSTKQSGSFVRIWRINKDCSGTAIHIVDGKELRGQIQVRFENGQLVLDEIDRIKNDKMFFYRNKVVCMQKDGRVICESIRTEDDDLLPKGERSGRRFSLIRKQVEK